MRIEDAGRGYVCHTHCAALRCCWLSRVEDQGPFLPFSTSLASTTSATTLSKVLQVCEQDTHIM